MDNHRSRPVHNNSAVTRGVLNSYTKDNRPAALLTSTSSSVIANQHATISAAAAREARFEA